ncbi:MAG: hypothetical protein EA352_07935 [Gemmatimonadales bacterium]|nr:MAG: hypothetical protein EA352_07935 [Gemmatimonadales bacterium]
MTDAPWVATGVRALLGPKWQGRRNRARRRGGWLRAVVLGGAALGFWALLFTLIYRMLLLFRFEEGVGDLLAAKLLGIALLTFLMILLLSNIITSLSTFFLSRDLELLMASPADPLHVYWARLTESAVNSSWMVVLLLVPLLAAYGVMYGGGPGFWLLSAVVVLPLLALPAVVGAAITLLLVNVFPARRTRDLLALMGLMAAAGVVVLVRVLQPERLVRPDEFRSVVAFVAELQTPTSPWFPSEWATEALLGWLTAPVWDPFPVLLLLLTAAAFLVVGGWLHLRFHPQGYSRAQEGAGHRDRARKGARRAPRTVPGIPVTVRQLAAKEVRVFFRDSTQWSQLILLGVLVVVYIYNIRVLPIGSAREELSVFLVNLVGFLNLGLAGFVVAAIAARFVFPAMSLEGRMTWLLRSSPLEPRTLFWTKYAVGTIPLLAVALPLIVVTNLILEVSPFLFWTSTLAMTGATLAMTALALGFGAIFPNYETENPAEIPTSFGGLLFMMASVTYLAVVVLLVGWSAWIVIRAGVEGAPLSGLEWLPVAAALGVAALVTAALVFGSLRAGIRRFEATELLRAE